ncbi:ribosome small subunit-dependent GTPase A [Achromobacter sp. GG226]|uniref:ribosome small subunit-dependent GTPase A n=1 Tax=Verticiella alkaliphila TaxID=2779529 RepID=UPI001C0B48F1|nr:ribosome small subunit-dependent GTPase A [Verticiella sp. GG226]MBU4612357.1 ribosome small subunit-dependent GTPase A [Verticiella sp. GG226]
MSRSRPAPAAAAGTLTGLVVSAHGRHYSVQLPDGSTRQCYPRGKRAQATVGDQVTVSLQGAAEGAIEAILPRRNLLFRSDQQRSKQFAANVDRLLLVVATEPDFSLDLAGRALVAATSAGIPTTILLNKADRTELLPRARLRAASLAGAGADILELSARDPETPERLAPLLAGQTSLLLGQSAMGKSTLLNALVPGADAATREHSVALGAGRHTTTSTRLYHLPQALERDGAPAYLIDSPGFQGFGLQHLSREEVARGFAEFAPFAGECRFYNCTHEHEPGCAILAAVAAGEIPAERHALYLRIVQENLAGERY